MLPDEVRDRDPQPLVTGPTKWRAEHCTTHHYACDCREWEHACDLEKWQARAERAEALLRECLSNGIYTSVVDGKFDLRARITAHLSENSRG